MREAGEHLVAVHIKDGRLGEIRRVPFGQGLVDFRAVFSTLQELDFGGPLVVEMWNEGEEDPIAVAARTLRWLREVRESTRSR